MTQSAKSVLVGMSGGVDSSVTAALLVREGYKVIGVTMQIWHRSSTFEDAGAMQGCCTVDAVDDARRVAARLSIPYYVPNFREEFAGSVVDDFSREYLAGRTPNPCVRCNQFVRFDGLIRRADELGVDLVATGHYARVEYDDVRREHDLMKAVDGGKDQSYMLHTLGQQHLRRILFPLGGLKKSQVRQIARDLELPVAEKPDSQEICFVAGNYRDFLQRHAGAEDRPGDIVERDGAVVGRHSGVHGFTVGQRRGLKIAAPEPRYVVELRPRDNTVVVGSREDASCTALTLSRLSFTGTVTSPRLKCGIKIRYRSPEQTGTLQIGPDETGRVEFDEPVWGAAPGQLAVFYDGDRVLGGGTIEEALKP